jgi:rhomboid family GlyGly-CTERM serine protease
MEVSAPRTRLTGWLASVNGDGRRGLGLLALLGLLLGLGLGGEPLRRTLRYDRAAIAAGEAWRLFTGHLVHLDLRHALLNGCGAALMWALFARDYTAQRWGLIVLASMLAIDAGFWWRDPALEWYVGASGLLHGVMAAGTVAHLRRGDPDGWLLAGFLVLKLVWEQTHGALPFSGPGTPVVVDAHLYGALAGGLCALAMRPRPESL